VLTSLLDEQIEKEGEEDPRFNVHRLLKTKQQDKGEAPRLNVARLLATDAT
jgi:hypothetical protein